MKASRVLFTLASGYRSLLRRVVEVGVSVLILALISSIISVPIWFLATRTPQLFNWIIVVLLVTAVLALVLRRQVSHRASGATPLVLIHRLRFPAGVLVSIGLITWGILDRLPVATVAGLVVVSLLLAWRRGVSR